MRGRVLKGIGGFYFVQTEAGILRAKGRGRFRKEGKKLCVGDEVEVEPSLEAEGDAVIREVLPRRNIFLRPAVANVDCLAVVLALSRPKADLLLYDKMLLTAERYGVQPIVVLNKLDEEREKKGEILLATYKPLYPVFALSAKTGEGMPAFEAAIRGYTVALAGASGVGKSSLINRLLPEAAMGTGTLSEKTERGRHTTRHVELFPYGAGYLFDTPGFTSFDLSILDERDLGSLFPEIRRASPACSFDDCRHRKEPGCAVRRLVSEGEIKESRYRSYLACLEEIDKAKKY